MLECLAPTPPAGQHSTSDAGHVQKPSPLGKGKPRAPRTRPGVAIAENRAAVIVQTRLIKRSMKWFDGFHYRKNPPSRKRARVLWRVGVLVIPRRRCIFVMNLSRGSRVKLVRGLGRARIALGQGVRSDKFPETRNPNGSCGDMLLER